MAEDPTAHPVDRSPSVSGTIGSTPPHARTTAPEAPHPQDPVQPSPVSGGHDNDRAGDRPPVRSVHEPVAGRAGYPSQRPATDDVSRTLSVWQSRTSRRLTAEDARQIVENATGFVAVLLDGRPPSGR